MSKIRLVFLVLIIAYAAPIFSAVSSFYVQGELTDRIFPRTDPKMIGLIYQMLKVIDLLFTNHDIPYWIDGGTVLGAVRHQGCIPWDDDADIVFHIEDKFRILHLKNEFAKFGFHLEQNEIIRLFPSKEIRYPYIDLAGYKLCNDNVYRYDYKAARDCFHRFYWLPSEINFLVRVKFGPLMLNAPNDMMRYIFNGYGKDCLSHAIFQPLHGGTANKRTIPQKVRVVDFSPAIYEITNFQIPLD